MSEHNWNKLGTSGSNTSNSRVDVMSQDSKHRLHICLSIHAAVSVLHSIGGIEHDVMSVLPV